MLRTSLVWVTAIVLVVAPVASTAADPFRFSSFFKKRPPQESAVIQLARTIDDLEKKLNRDGTVAVKAPDIWGEARLTKHRQEFEREMEKDIGTFDFRLNAAISRSDQAFLDNALVISAAATALNSDGTRTPITGPTLDFNVAQSLLPTITSTSGVDEQGNPVSPEPQDNQQVFITAPGGLPGLGTQLEGTDRSITLEPEIVLDQKARYLNHLHEIRRLNEGDDTADSPGYALNLVRIPVSIMPGGVTRRGHGAEVTITATPHITEELLPQTFRHLVINDLVDVLAPAVRRLAEELPHLDQNLAGQHSELERFLMTDEGQVIVEYYGENGIANWLADRSAYNPTNLRPAQLSQDALDALLRLLNNRQQAATKIGATLKADRINALQAEILIQVAPGAPPMNRKTYEELRDTIASVRAELGQKIYSLAPQLLGTNVGAITRRSREPVASSQVPFAFGLHELLSLAYDLRARSPRGQLIHLSDARSYLAEELQQAYDLVSTTGTVANQMITDPAFVMGDGYSSHSLADRLRNITHENVQSIFDDRVRIANQFSRELQFDAQGQRRTLHLPSVTTSLAWAVIVESVLLNEQLNEDVVHVSRDPECGCMCPCPQMFCGPNPSPEARKIFVDYVNCRWPIHVFALDPQAQDQNVADTFSMRREMQLAIALAFANGRISAQNMTRYVRRLELDMQTIALNRTAAAFGHGRDVFGWRFYPRVQTPPFESTSTTVFRDLLGGGPSKDDLRRTWEIEPGMRECTAVVLMPSFITHMTFDIRGNYFPLGRHKFRDPSDTRTSIEDNMEMSHKIRLMENATCSIAAEANRYRDGEVQRLLRRADQLAKKLPLQTVHARVPNENTLGGFEMFSSGVTDLAPELLDFYGMPGVDTTKDCVLFLVGNNFSVHDTKVLAGNRNVSFDLVSRQVMKVTIPAGVQTVEPFRCLPGERDCKDPEHVVDVHVATPYGVSQNLHIPVINDGCNAVSGYRWAKENLRATYRVAQVADETQLDDTKARVLMAPPFALDVHVPVGPFSHPQTAKLSLVVTSPQLGTAVIARDADVALNPVSRSYQIRDKAFVDLQKAIMADFIAAANELTATGATLSSDVELRIQAAIQPTNLTPSIPLDNTLTLHVKLEVQ